MLILKHCGVERSEPMNLSEPHYRRARVCSYVRMFACVRTAINTFICSSTVLMAVVVAEHSTDHCVAE